MPFRILLLLALGFVFAESPTCAQTALMEKWTPGEKLTYVIEDIYNSKTELEDGFFELSQSLILETTWKITSVGTEGEAALVVTIDRVQFGADGKGAAAVIQKLRFDSKNEQEPQSRQEESVFDALGAFVGSPIAVTVDTQGSVTKFDLSDALATHLTQNATRELAGFFGDVFTAQGVRQRLTSWLVARPNDPVSKGDTWRQTPISRGGQSVLSVHAYSFAGSVIRDGQTVVQIDVKPELEIRADESKKGGVKITEQNGEGVAYLDGRTGRILEVVLRHHAVLESFAKTTLDSRTTAKLRPQPSR